MDTIMTLIRYIQKWIRRKGTDKGISISAFLLCAFGMVMIGDASVGMAITRGDNYAVINMAKQLVFLLAGGFIYFWIQHKFRVNRKSATLNIYYLVTLAAMFICRLWNINGSHAWIKLGPITIQPSEFMKIVLILLYAQLLGTALPRIKRKRAEALSKPQAKDPIVRKAVRDYASTKIFWDIIGKLAVYGGIAFLICGFYQGDLGSALIIVGICLTLFFSTNERDRNYKLTKKVLYCIIAVGIVGVYFITKTGGAGILKPHQIARFITWLDPLNDKYIYGTSYQIVNGMVGYSNGGLIGRGFGNSIMKYGYIPEAQNDYISAIIAEEFGLLGMVLLLIPYCVIIYRLFSYAMKMEDRRSKLILIGVASYFFFHLLVNLGGVSGLIPMTGVPLLLVSAGGTSTLAALTALGIAQNIIGKYNRKQMQALAEKEISE